MTAADHSNLHLAWSRLFFAALARAGVRDVVISPGSRSTPLVLACASEAALRTHVVIDERAAAFVALGHARATGVPSALLCTSGTAGAHYLPAVIEASQSFIPLIVITADRPWEAYDAAAPQTVDQVKLFGGHVRHYAELGLPDASPTALRAVSRIAAQLVHRATSPTPGAVHLDARFRKPLEPVDAPSPEAWEGELARLAEAGPPRVLDARAAVQAPDASAIEFVARAIGEGGAGWIVCGPSLGPQLDGGATLRAAVGALAAQTGFAVLPEATSGARFGALGGGVRSVGAFDALLRDAGVRDAVGGAPSVLIELGAPPTSSGYAQLLAGRDPARSTRVVVAPHGWQDPAGDASAMVFADPARFAEALRTSLASAGRGPSSRATAATERLRTLDALAWDAVEREGHAELSEADVARQLVGSLPADAALVVGNSSPVRDLDTFVRPTVEPLRVIHQRGASGIDGLVAGAAGVREALARGPVALLVGDLSLLHDLGSLLIAREATRPLVLVVVQNQGGRIFEQLPIARRDETRALLEPFFVTPRTVDLAHAAAAYGVAHRRVASRAELAAALTEAHGAPGCTMIEAVVPPTDGALLRAGAFAAVARAARGAWL